MVNLRNKANVAISFLGLGGILRNEAKLVGHCFFKNEAIVGNLT
jgi:hypothetical protein